uniref:Uncharacterized protein n=1 Tax=Molossus molossus TaxID=27622 RepID=A0A7J8J0K6_MOLMO|nr:hypothetical protein HJG59_010331 [Molossus molossus]
MENSPLAGNSAWHLGSLSFLNSPDFPTHRVPQCSEIRQNHHDNVCTPHSAQWSSWLSRSVQTEHYRVGSEPPRMTSLGTSFHQDDQNACWFVTSLNPLVRWTVHWCKLQTNFLSLRILQWP